MSVTDRNRRRIDRMSTWISHAEKTSGKNEDHIRFLFYWIAYEAAHQTYGLEIQRSETGQKEQDCTASWRVMTRGGCRGFCARRKAMSCASSSCGKRIRPSGIHLPRERNRGRMQVWERLNHGKVFFGNGLGR